MTTNVGHAEIRIGQAISISIYLHLTQNFFLLGKPFIFWEGKGRAEKGLKVALLHFKTISPADGGPILGLRCSKLDYIRS